MSDFATGQGYYLAELIKNYHHFRDAYLEWAAPIFDDKGLAVLHYQRSLVAWYEARIDDDEPYVGDVMSFLRAATAHFTGTLDTFKAEWTEQGMATLGPDPSTYLPAPIKLTPRQQQLLDLFKLQPKKVRELLLLAYYHQLSDSRLSTILEVGERTEDATFMRRHYLNELRQSWRDHGLLDGVYLATPEQEEVIDRYLRGELDVAQRWEVEAERSSDTLFRDALELREDWEYGLQLLGRQDTLETLQSEEEKYHPKVVVRMPKRSSVNFNSLGGLLAVALFGVLLYLLYTTFGPATEQKLYEAYFKPFPNITRSATDSLRDDQLERELAEMLVPYDRGNYLLTYNELLPASTAYPSARLYLGVCALALNEPRRALEWLDQYLPGDRFEPYARWYMALAYLAEGSRPAALAELVQIASTPGHPYEIPATQLIEALE